MSEAYQEKPKELLELEKTLKELYEKMPAAVIVGAMVLSYLLQAPKERPKWLKDCPRIHGPKNAAWRGKGSFGHGFGANKVKHK